MQYIVTWTEGEEVCYRFVSEEEIKDLIEDDKESAKYLIKGLKEHGYVIDHCDNGKDGLFMASP